MDKPFNLGFIIGRMQHLHSGHVKMIDAGLSLCKYLIVLVGSSQEVMTERNPFSLKTRMDVIRKVYDREINEGRLLLGHIDDTTNEDDHSKEWGDYVLQRVDMWRHHYSIDHDLDCMIYGNDEERSSWYRPELINNVSQLIISRPDDGISATKMRKSLVDSKFDDWNLNAPRGIDNIHWFMDLREELLEVPFYKGLSKDKGDE